MATESQTQQGIVLDTRLIIQAIKYYAIIGSGLGALGVVLLLQLGAGDSGGTIISGLLSMVVLAFAVLSGPIIAAFIGYATAGTGIGDIRTRAVNSGIANGVGFAIFGIIVATILWAGLAIVLSGSDGGAASGGGSSGPIEITKLVTLIILMMIPNSLVGGSITFFLEGRGGTSP